MDAHYLYLAVNAGSIVAPLLLSFDRKVAFYKTWKYFIPANLITLTFFIVWDILFANAGIWGFNDAYLTGTRILALPIEEWLFFFTIPYACVFLYEVFKAWIPGNPFKRWGKPMLYLAGIIALIFVLFNFGRWYTFYTGLFTFAGVIVLARKPPQWLGWYAFTYLVIVIPFILSNGILTGLEFWKYPIINQSPEVVSDQIVWYNNAHNLGVRIFSIPVDDLLYGFLLIGMNIAVMERLKKRV